MIQTVKVDFHTHTRYSGDSLASIPKLLATARRRGLNRLVITDHNTIKGALEAQALDPELVIVGEEILTTRGELLASFVTEEIPAGLEPNEAIRRLRDQGAFISVSHPFDLHRHGWAMPDLLALTDKVDAIEVFNARCLRQATNLKAVRFAEYHDLPGTVGTDAHDVSEIGHACLVLPAFSSADELRQVIRMGRIEARLSVFWVHLFSTYAKQVKKFLK